MMEEQQQLLSTGHVVVDRVTVSVIDKRLTEDIIEQLEGVQPQVGPAKAHTRQGDPQLVELTARGRVIDVKIWVINLESHLYI